MQGEMGHIVVSTEASPRALPAPPPSTPLPYWSLLRGTCQRRTMVTSCRRQEGLASRKGRTHVCFIRHVEIYYAYLSGH